MCVGKWLPGKVVENLWLGLNLTSIRVSAFVFSTRLSFSTGKPQLYVTFPGIPKLLNKQLEVEDGKDMKVIGSK